MYVALYLLFIALLLIGVVGYALSIKRLKAEMDQLPPLE